MEAYVEVSKSLGCCFGGGEVTDFSVFSSVHLESDAAAVIVWYSVPSAPKY